MPELSPTLLKSLNKAIASHNLESVGDAIRANAAPCLSIAATETDDFSTTGNTRFGGEPDLPKDASWPTDPDDNARFANFVAQINFAELPNVDGDDVLPKTGVLYIFVRFMEAAASPAILDTIFYDGDTAQLERRSNPPNESLCNEYLVDLIPQRISAVPSVSIPSYRKQFRSHVEQNTAEVDGDDGEMRLMDLESDLCADGQIGQLLGFANPGDDQENLYRQVVLALLGKRPLVYNDYWDSMEEYEAYIEEWRDDKSLVAMYRDMHDGVVWLTSNREMIQSHVDEWRLLLRVDSNFEMNLSINDADPMYVFIRNEDLANRDFSNLACEVTQG
ncbi:DUF1963 domain-containing protein [Allorhodopirellula solitaria]|uniref:DUF1963 domain-containing protein n=1 Tax=Allorhodopirellula solitaria TaxID=2527987 RepID=A0A5C5XY27_9BACT|nr:DUF1963 domain-containing protein [Allorhodopirellula solitaria]TWT67588.1 hypothetical protein CA85_24410 [Allorhodopirellula solitaria]